MPSGAFELEFELSFDFHQTHPGLEKTWHHPAEGPDYEITEISLNGSLVETTNKNNHKQIKINCPALQEYVRAQVDEFIIENYGDLMEQDAPDPDRFHDDEQD